MVFKIALMASFLTLAAWAHDVTGKWAVEVQTDAGTGSPAFTFRQDGEKLTGTYSGIFGSAELTGTVKGDAIQFSFEVSIQDQKGKMVYTGKITAPGKMQGEVEIVGLGKGTWTGTKKE